MYREKVKILLLDNESMFVTGLKVTLQSIPGQEIVRVIDDMADLEECCIQYKPDAVFIRDFMFGKYSGFTAADVVKRSFPEIKVIMIISLPKSALVKEAKFHGIDSCLLATDEPAFYNTCLWDTLNGKSHFPVIDDNKWGSSNISLQEIELDIVRCTCLDMSLEEIEAKLGLAEETVHVYVSNILSKTGYKDVAGLKLAAAQKGFLIKAS